MRLVLGQVAAGDQASPAVTLVALSGGGLALSGIVASAARSRLAVASVARCSGAELVPAAATVRSVEKATRCRRLTSTKGPTWLLLRIGWLERNSIWHQYPRRASALWTQSQNGKLGSLTDVLALMAGLVTVFRAQGYQVRFRAARIWFRTVLPLLMLDPVVDLKLERHAGTGKSAVALWLSARLAW